MTDCLQKITEAIATDDLANAVEILKTNVSADIVNEALFCACKDGKPRFVELFLEAGADVNYIRLISNEHNANELVNPLTIAYAYGGSEDRIQVVRILLEHGADVHFRNDLNLWEASCCGHYEIVKLLLEAGADVHANDDAALGWASHRGRFEIVKLLLEVGADVHDRNDALHWASLYGFIKIVKILIDYGADKEWIHPRASPVMWEYIPVNPRRIWLGVGVEN